MKIPESRGYPITDEQRITGNVIPREVLPLNKMCQHGTQRKYGKVQGPDAQDAADIEQPE